MGNSVIINKNQFKQSADSVTFDIPLMGEKKAFWFCLKENLRLM